jgi:hypothetical protein
MHRPSGTTVVTAVLGALSLFGIVWSHDTKGTGSLSQATPVAATDVGTAFQLHSGSWRARPAPDGEALRPAQAPAAFPTPQAPTGLDAALSAPAAPATVSAAASLSADRIVPIQKITRQAEPPTPPGQALPAEADEPPETVADRAPAVRTPASPEGRMALSGPDAAPASSPADRAGPRTSTDHSASRAPELAPQPNAVTPSQPKFGPDVFKTLDRNGS